MSVRRYLIVGTAAVILSAPVPLWLLPAGAMLCAIIAIPVLLPRSYIMDTVLNGVMFAVPLLLVDMMLFRIGGEICQLLIAVAVLLVLLWRVLETLWRGNADRLSPEAIAARHRNQVFRDTGTRPTFVFTGHAHNPHSGESGSSSCSSSSC